MPWRVCDLGADATSRISEERGKDHIRTNAKPGENRVHTTSLTAVNTVQATYADATRYGWRPKLVGARALPNDTALKQLVFFQPCAYLNSWVPSGVDDVPPVHPGDSRHVAGQHWPSCTRRSARHSGKHLVISLFWVEELPGAWCPLLRRVEGRRNCKTNLWVCIRRCNGHFCFSTRPTDESLRLE